MKKTINQFRFEKLSKNELIHINSIKIEGSEGRGGGNPEGLNGPCGTEPDPRDPNYVVLHQQWTDCMEMYQNPNDPGNCIF